MDIKPFRLKLAKIDGKSQRALSALFSFLPMTGMRESFIKAIEETISSHINIKTSFNLDAVTEDSFKSFFDRMPDPVLIAVLGAQPRQGKILLEIDAGLAGFFIERLLGSGAETFPSPKPLSEIEQGVLQYLILQVLAHVYRLCGGDARVHFTFEKFIFKPDDLKNIIGFEDTVFGLGVRMNVGSNAGFIRLLFPSPLVEELYLNVQAKGDARKAEEEYLWGKMGEYGHVKLPLWAEGGRTTLTTGDMKNLEAGDVILLEETNLQINEKGLQGSIILRAGDGNHGGFVSEVTADPKLIHCRITNIKKGEDII
jgi:flagellar motor switch protein FliM